MSQVQPATKEYVAELAHILLKTMSVKFGGECTINELRAVNTVLLCESRGFTCSVTCISKNTGIPMSTVSRSVSNLICKRWLTEKPHLEDRRKRILSFGPRSIDQTYDDIAATIRWLSDDRKHDLPT